MSHATRHALTAACTLAVFVMPTLAVAQADESGRVPEGNGWIVWLVLAAIAVPALIALFINPHRENEA